MGRWGGEVVGTWRWVIRDEGAALGWGTRADPERHLVPAQKAPKPPPSIRTFLNAVSVDWRGRGGREMVRVVIQYLHK